MIYIYCALDRENKITRGEIEAKSENDASDKIKHIGLNPFLVEKKLKNKTEKVLPFKDQWTIASQLSQLMGKGIDVTSCLGILKHNEREGSKKRNAIEKAEKHLLGGKTISSAFSLSGIFNEKYIQWLKMGEAIGKTQRSFKSIYEVIKNQYETREQIKKAAIYPSIIIILSLSAIVFISTYIFPVFSELIGDLPMHLWPWSTRAMLFLAKNMKKMITLITIVMVSFYYFYKYSYRMSWGKKFHREIWSSKLYRNVARKYFELRFLRILVLMQQDSISIQDAIKYIHSYERNPFIKEEINKINISISDGKSVGQSIEKTILFTDYFKSFFLKGEQGGILSEISEQLLEIRKIEINYNKQRILKFLEPMLILIVSIFVGFVVIGTIMPLMEMGNYLL
ncbi:MAG: hypothetical protein GXZ11_01075 [Tissierellia bacterium]|nr:hypothetical protein [Tissierellia bacterium]